MKTIRINLLNWAVLGLLTINMSCSDWLDVNPRTEKQESDMYQSEKGFQNVMNGIYIQLASADLYGKNTSYYFNDLLAGYWTKESNTTEEYISSYNFSQSDVEDIITTIWSSYYTCIAHVNDLLENLEKTDVRFSYGNKELLLGEAYGLRAFIHLEVLRLFGPVPHTASDNTTAIPYVTELSRDPAKLTSLTYGEVKQHILNDLDLAEGYLQNDPFTLGSMYDFNNPGSNKSGYQPEDDWHYYRQTHVNLYAIDAIRARFYQYVGDTDEATRCAQKVIGAKNPDGTSKFELANEANSYTTQDNPNLVMQCEHVFALHSSNLQKYINGVMVSSSTAKPDLYLNNSWIASVYENSESDIRYRSGRYFQTEGAYAYYLKYYQSGSIEPINMIPLIRLAEMYLILIENLPIEEARTYFETFRQARSMDFSTGIDSETAKKERVEKEYRKDFWGEGQMFFYYKRHNMTNWTLPQTMSLPVNGFVIPKPKGQTSFE